MLHAASERQRELSEAATAARKQRDLEISIVNKALEKAFCDGEDYELLFTLPHSIMSTDFESEWQKNFPQIQISRIGNIVEQRGSARLLNYCDQRPLNWDGGFDHFKK